MKKLVILVVLLLLVVACKEEEKEILFKGSSEYWEAEVVVNVINGSEKKQLELRYKGNNINSIESFNYFIESNKNEVSYGEESVSLDENGFYSNNALSSDSPTTITEKDTINITISWNDQIESF